MVEAVRYASYGIFLLGAARSFRDNGSWPSVAVMALAVLMSAAASLPALGGSALAGTGQAALLSSAQKIEFFAVWLLFPLAILSRQAGRRAFFHQAVAGVEAGWFIVLMMMFYSRHTPQLY